MNESPELVKQDTEFDAEKSEFAKSFQLELNEGFRVAYENAKPQKRGEKFAWATFSHVLTERKNAALAACKSEGLRRHIETAFTSVSALARQESLNKLERNGKTPEKIGKTTSQISSEREKLLLLSAGWQGDCLDMIRSIGNIPEGKAAIAAMWVQMRTLAAQRQTESEDMAVVDFFKIRNGILAMNVTLHTLEALIKEYENIEIVETTPEKDVHDSVDFGLRRTLAEGQYQDYVLQVKSHAKGLGVLHAESVTHRSGAGSVDAKAAVNDKLYSGMKHQQARTGIPTFGIKIEVDGSRDKRIDETTGVPEDDYIEQQCEGEFGQNVKQIMGLDRNQLESIAKIDTDERLAA